MPGAVFYYAPAVFIWADNQGLDLVVSGQSTAAPRDGANLSVLLLGPTVLDRMAYRCLLEHLLGQALALDCDFEPVSVWAALRMNPDVALVDGDGAPLPALDAVDMILRLKPATRVLVVGTASDAAQLQPWSRRRLHAYVVKGGGVGELRAAFDALRENGKYFSKSVRHVLRVNHALGRSRERTQLSRREAELLPLLARGLTLREAAQRMSISYKTADSYRTNLLCKLGLRDRVDLARYAIRQRIIEP
jgi:DNA-binding NarL/FixJ family response regulator